MRERRKGEHLRGAVALPDGPALPGFGDISIVHNALADASWDEISLKTQFCGKGVPTPFLINAITGGGDESGPFNKALAKVAGSRGLALAVGSQRVALGSSSGRDSFEVVRENNPQGVVFANLGVNATPEEAHEAVKMIDADFLQLHLNTPQELVMPEGDRSFSSATRRVREISEAVSVPVVVKEVGFGISREVAGRIATTGASALDVGGKGGTNFLAIEDWRREAGRLPSDLLSWGLTTAVSIIEVVTAKTGLEVVASGGIRTGLDAAKCLALGAALCGVAKPFYQAYVEGGLGGIERLADSLLWELKLAMALCGCEKPDGMITIPMVITGETRQWLDARGIDLRHFAAR